MKKRLLILFLALLCTFTFTNLIFAVTHNTTYLPYGPLVVDPWATQPLGAPWCFDTCMKIVLKDAQQKNLVNPLGGGFNIQNINTIVGAPVPEELVHRVLLNNDAIGEIGTINDAPQAQRQAFFGHITSFFDYYLGNIAVHQRIGGINDNRKIGLLNGLLEVALEDELNDLWGNLDANTKKMIMQESAQKVLNCVQQDTGIIGTIHNITNQAQYNAALQTIVTEVDTNNRMVVLIFQNSNNYQQSHACVAYMTQDNAPHPIQRRIIFFNPWGNPLEIDSNTNPGPYFNISNNPAAPRNWVLNKYVTFNY